MSDEMGIGVTEAGNLRYGITRNYVEESPKPAEPPVWTAEERDTGLEALRTVNEALKVLVEGQQRLERALKAGAVGAWGEPVVKVGGGGDAGHAS